MRRTNVSNNVIRRLPRYLRKLEELTHNGVDRISSSELGKQMGLTASQIRQDFSCFGEFGQQGYGYNIAVLEAGISEILGRNKKFSVIIIGVGNLGHALIENFDFASLGYRLSAAFDINPAIIGTELNNVPIYDMERLGEFLSSHPVDIAVLCVPKQVADLTAGSLAREGVPAIWNFTNIELDLSSYPNVIVEDVHFSDSLLALGYYLNESLSADEA